MTRFRRISLMVGVAGLIAAATASADPVTVLDQDNGSFRVFLGFKTPPLRNADGKLVPLLYPKTPNQKEEDRKPVPMVRSAPPPAGWAGVDFDGTVWPRVHGDAVVGEWVGENIYTIGTPADWNRICLRGTFVVDDPQKVGALTLSADYYGGLVVYVNGVELTRQHLPAGELSGDTLADPYPPEAYIRPDGKRYSEGDEKNKELAERVKVRTRHLAANGGAAGVAVPSSMLRKGVNVIAIQSLAAPLSTLIVETPLANRTWRGEPTPWPHAGVINALLSADSPAGLGSAAAPGEGVRLTNSEALESVLAWDFAMPQEAVRPIRLLGLPNGTFSGKVVLSSGAAIRNLKASATDLVGAGGAKIPASAIEIRWAEQSKPDSTRNGEQRFERLLPQMPAEVAPVKVSIRNRKAQPAPAAVVPVWATVRVPRGAAAGEYEGTLNVSADGAAGPAQFAVPIRLKVFAWTLPDSGDFVTHHDWFESPESVARWYKADLWSDRHFALVGQSLKLLGEVGNGLCVLPLVEQGSNLGNRESMVRWVRQKDGSFKHDYTILDRYLETYKAAAGRPDIVALYVWSYYKEGDKEVKVLPVTALDPETGKTESMLQPPYGTQENQDFWKPVLGEVRKRLEKLGWFDVTAVAFTSYCYFPAKDLVDEYKAIWPDGKWMNCSHGNPSVWGGMPVPYSEWVWGCGGLYNPDSGKGGGYPAAWTAGAKRIEMANPRVGQGIISRLSETSPLICFRFISEGAMQGNLRGIGHVGGDFWPVPIGPRGRLEVMCNTQFAVGMPNSVTSLVAPGPDGPIASTRYEMFREGVQVAEAIAYCQKAVIDKKVDADFAARLAKLLDERARYYLRTNVRPGWEANWLALESSDWQKRDGELFDLAAEAAATIGGK
ncbi:MAG: hypothetical protein BIFFINMI_03261 [Phycisphaerae bacterium]|nr:hypothetical protein [Phycisphaerae bacterium]